MAYFDYLDSLLVVMLAVALLATMTGRFSCRMFALFAEHKLDFLRQFLPSGNGPPSRGEFSGLLNVLDAEPLAAAMALFGGG